MPLPYSLWNYDDWDDFRRCFQTCTRLFPNSAFEQRRDGLYNVTRPSDEWRIGPIFLTPEQCAELGMPTCERPLPTTDPLMQAYLLL